MLLHQVKGSVPARLVEEVQRDLTHGDDARNEAGLVVVGFIGPEGPVDEERTPDDVGAGNEAPVAAVEGDGAVVSHGEVIALGHDEVGLLDVIGQVERPLAVTSPSGGRDGGKSSR